jgi:MFS family permease
MPDVEAESHARGWVPLLVLLLAAFGVFGLWSGCNAVLLADLSRVLDLSPGPLGVALFAGAASSIAAMASLGWVADRLGRKAFLVGVMCLFGVGIAGLALVGGFWALVAVVILVFSSGGLYDVGINATAVDLEGLSGRRFMSFLHAAYSGGAVLGAVGSGVLLSAGLGYRLVYLSLLLPLAAVALAVAAARFPGPAAYVGGSSLVDGEAGTGRWGLYRSGALLLVAAIAGLGLLSEGQMGSWSGVYLRGTLGMPALVGGAGVAVFFAAMALGRLATGVAVARLGNRRALLGAGLLTALGMSLALSTTRPALAVAGFLVVGLGVSGVAPLAYSAGGDLAPERAGAAVSVVTSFGYGGFLLGPVLVGGLAEVLGLRAALGVVALCGLAIFALSTRLE